MAKDMTNHFLLDFVKTWSWCLCKKKYEYDYSKRYDNDDDVDEKSDNVLTMDRQWIDDGVTMEWWLMMEWWWSDEGVTME